MDFRDYIFKADARTKFTGMAAIFILVSFLLYAFLITPLVAQRKMLRFVFSSQKKLFTTITENITRLDVLEEGLNKANAEFAAVEKRCLTEERLPSFFTELRSLAAENRTDILNLKVGEKKPVSPDNKAHSSRYEQLPVDISLKGHYLDTLTFMARLREGIGAFNIAKISMSADEKEAKGIVITNTQLILYLTSE